MDHMESVNVSELVERLGSDEDGVRKMAAFKLQSNIGDPSFADLFILEGGLTRLRHLVLHATGNTLAYSLTSFARLLEVDKGWEYVNQDLVHRVVELVVTHPLVNILRGAMSILVFVVSHPYNATNQVTQPDSFGFRALKPAIAVHPQFLEMLVSRLSSADHALCANALQLINSLMREAITNEEDSWPKFIKRLQDLGVIEGVYHLMQSNAIQDLSQPLLEFQALTKVLLRKWKDMPLDLERPEHRRALKTIHAASAPEKPATPIESREAGSKRKHNPEKWRRLGFQTETPSYEFDEVGYLGMMDLMDYVRKNEDGFQRQLLEQSTKPNEKRCPIARASLAVTSVLTDLFEVEKADVDDAKFHLAFESKTNFDRVFRPLLLQWSILHTAGLLTFFRLWQTTCAEVEDFDKIYDLVRILFQSVLDKTTRTKPLQEVQKEINEFELSKLRQLQMEMFEVAYEETWGHHLRQIKDELGHEALQFVKEQRIRCLLAGAWFPNTGPREEAVSVANEEQRPFRFAKLSHNRRYLHYTDFDVRTETEPVLDQLEERLDLTLVTSVTSNVTASPTDFDSNKTRGAEAKSTSTTITIYGHASPSRPATATQGHNQSNSLGQNNIHSRNNSSAVHNTTTQHRKTPHHQKEIPLLTLHPQNKTLASEWLDGFLMLLNQQPITNETAKLINMIKDYGLKIRLLNVRFDELGHGGPVEGPALPSREGVDEDFWYDDFGG